MSRIFLSHSGRDNRQAIALRQWLIEKDHTLAKEIFLDLDKRTGIQAGVKWKDALRQASTRCEAVICLLSSNWEASHECKVEYRFAEYLNKRIFCAAISPLTGEDPTREWQRIDLYGEGRITAVHIGDGGVPVRFLTEGLNRLRQGLGVAGIGTESFVWPPPDDPDRAPYRGWKPLDKSDAAVFFGRDAQILRGLDVLRGMRRSGVATMFVVLGPSGTGKSSYLRAGLLPRLRRDDGNFVILDIVRPERNVITGDTGLAQAMQATRSRLGLTTPSLGEIKQACLGDPAKVGALLRETQRAARAQLLEDCAESPLPTLVLPLDQAEELVSADAGSEAPAFLQLIADLAKGNATNSNGSVGMIVAATIRTDRYEALQTAPQLAGVGTVLFDDLKPMPTTEFKEVITGPAARATHGGRPLEVDPSLVNRLLEDCTEGADTLPLLALTLARLFEYATEGRLTLAHYESMGGLQHIVQSEIDELLAVEPDERAKQLELLRAAFIPWLATINADNDQAMRRLARWADLPEDSRPLIQALVAKRLMVKDTRDGHVVVEVALESLLRQWDELAGWLREQQEDLKAADNLERNAAAWEANNRDSAWLLEGSRLADAESLAASPEFCNRLADTHDYVAASRQRENDRLRTEQERQNAELRNARERQRTAEIHAGTLRRRSRVVAVVAVIAVVGAVTAALGFVQATEARSQAQERFREATSLRLVSDSLAMLDRTGPGSDTRALQQLLAARSLASTPDDGALYTAAVKTVATSKIIETPQAVPSVAFSPDGKRLAAGSADHTVRLWDADTGQPIGQPLTGHQNTVFSVAFSPDGKHLASASADHTVRLWNADTGQPIGQPLTGHQNTVSGVAFSPDGKHLASASADHTVRLWNADTGQPIGQPLTGHQNTVSGVAFSPDGKHLASASADHTVRLWNADTGQPIGQPLTGHQDIVFGVAFSPDGHRLVSGSADNTVRLWNADTGQPVGQPFTGPQDQDIVFAVAFSPDGKRFASGSANDTVRLWNADTGQPIGQPLTGHQDQVTSVAFSADGKRIVSASRDDTIRLWNVDAGQPIGAPLTGHRDIVDSVAFSPDGKRIVSASADHTIRLWNADASKPYTGHQHLIYGVAFSPDGQRIASASRDTTIRLWDVNTREPIGQPLTGHQASVSTVAFSPDGKRIVSGGVDRTVRLWNADTGQPIGQPLTGHRNTVLGVAFSPDGKRIVSAGADRTLRLWNADTGQPIGQPLTGHRNMVFGVAFSPDGQRIASASRDETIRLWDANTGQAIGKPITGHKDYVFSVAFSPDGQRIASASREATIRLWDANTGQPIGQALAGHQDTVYSVAFSPDGKRIVSGSGDDTIRLWDPNTGQPIGQPIAGHQDVVYSVAFSPDGRRIVSGSADSTVRLWPGEARPEDLCDKLTANMSQQQWRDRVSADIGYIQSCPGLPVPGD